MEVGRFQEASGVVQERGGVLMWGGRTGEGNVFEKDLGVKMS